MKQLQNEFYGKGSVDGFMFKQIEKSECAYIYSVTTPYDTVHYEVFEHIETNGGDIVIGGKNVHYEAKVLYPKDNSFGITAYCTSTFPQAQLRFNEINERVKNRKNNN